MGSVWYKRNVARACKQKTILECYSIYTYVPLFAILALFVMLYKVGKCEAQ